MEETFVPFRGIKKDLKGRLLCYKQDWTGGIRAGIRILAPTTYTFFASTIPVISFGEQLERDTEFANSEEEEGLLTVDENIEGYVAAFGDIAIECLSVEFKRDIAIADELYKYFSGLSLDKRLYFFESNWAFFVGFGDFSFSLVFG
ncbi:hypothetical protein L6452_01317 [Arctium lappa]|uniref:Uncharacterized protein n=1 Tax=Arctium lappa TaxID=4217 RepID=A0ACB9FGB5_ARCLA|nr:hypothetical protein L6452_01317 [Arctium lappa]